MAYGIKYYSEFDSFKTLQSYILNIYQKDYTGGSTELLLSGSPVVQEWQEDDPIAPIKGSTLKISYISDGISLDDFYSNEDNTFLVELKRLETGETMFKGYILQDDCEEIQVDFNHIIQLTASDNLGLLKDVTLDQAAKLYGTDETDTRTLTRIHPPLSYYYAFQISGASFDWYIGQTFIVSGLSGANGTYTVSSLQNTGGVFIVGVVGVIPAFTSGVATIDWVQRINIVGYIPLKTITRLCLLSTSLELSSRVITELKPIGGSTDRWLEDTYIQGETFLSNSEWMSCYDVLERIMSRFNATTFQSNGSWWIVRWLEMWRYILGTSMTGWSYDKDFNAITSITENQRDFPFYNGSDIETGLLKSITRPFEYSKETFNYTQTDNLLKNSNFTEEGSVINSYESGENRDIERYNFTGEQGFTVQGTLIDIKRDQTFNIVGSGGADGTYKCLRTLLGPTYFVIVVDTAVPLFSPTNATINYQLITEYTALHWYDSSYAPPYFPRFIRVIRDFQENELDRYIVVGVSAAGGAGIYACESTGIEISAQDKIELSFDFRTENSNPGGGSFGTQFDFALKLQYGSTNNYISSGPMIWVPNITSYNAFAYSVLVGDNAQKWHTVTVTSEPAPFDGIFYIYLRGYPIYDNMFYKNFQIKITNTVSGQVNIIGHTHKNSQDLIIKNNRDVEIYMDDSPRSTIAGALYLETLTENLRNRTTLWNYNGSVDNNIRLGELMTNESEFWRWKPTSKFSGTILNLLNPVYGNIFSMFAIVTMGGGDKRYVPGSLAIDYKNGTADCTLWEVTDFTVTYSDFEAANLYLFNYLYEKS
jgi:hypothetical protein